MGVFLNTQNTMATQNTGFARMKALTVTKGDYTHTYYITGSFVDPDSQRQYQAIDDSTFAQMSEDDFAQRRDDFIHYVCYTEDGLGDQCPNIAQGSVMWDPSTCPITLQKEQEQWAE